MEDRVYKVYVHITPSNKYYVGITKRDTYQRWGKNGYNYKSNKHFWNAIQKYGWDNIQHEVVADNLTESEAKNFEILLIKKLESQSPMHGYNITKGGDGGGYNISEESRIKMSQAKKGKNTGSDNVCYGISPKERMDKDIYDTWLYKHQHPEDYWYENKRIKIICLNNKEVFNSIEDAAKKYNINSSDICTCCKGKLYHAGRDKNTGELLSWQYYKDYLNGVKKKERRYKKVRLKNTGEVFNTAKLAGETYGIPSPNITLCCQGKYKRAGKDKEGNPYVWEYAV